VFALIKAVRNRAEAIQAARSRRVFERKEVADDRDLRTKVICCTSGYTMFRHRERCRKMLKARRWCGPKLRPAVIGMRYGSAWTMFRDDRLPRER
jgi:hypothetical protein